MRTTPVSSSCGFSLLIDAFGTRIMPPRLNPITKNEEVCMRTRSIVVCFAVLTVVALLSVTVMAADNLAGTWKLNVAKSKYSPGPAPKSNTIKFDAVDGGIKLTADGMDAQGRKTHNDYTAKYDGKDYPTHPMLDGKPNPNAANMVSYKKIDDYT